MKGLVIFLCLATFSVAEGYPKSFQPVQFSSRQKSTGRRSNSSSIEARDIFEPNSLAKRACPAGCGSPADDIDFDIDDDIDNDTDTSDDIDIDIEITTYTQIIYWYYWVFYYLEIWIYVEVDVETETLSLTSSSVQTSSTATVSASNSAEASSLFASISDSASAAATSTPDLDTLPTSTSTMNNPYTEFFPSSTDSGSSSTFTEPSDELTSATFSAAPSGTEDSTETVPQDGRASRNLGRDSCARFLRVHVSASWCFCNESWVELFGVEKVVKFLGSFHPKSPLA
ncbi:hypothetical protein BDV12DRAFT_202735 [Aspergillus spectabilis]